jgi:signal transduction histidine kinase
VNVEVAEALRHVAHDAERRGVTLLTSYASDIPVILGDPVELQQVVINLVVNAMEAVASYSGNLKTIRIETRVRPGGAEIAVIDSGAGVRPEDEARLFQSTFTTKKDGMGFGLSIVRTIVEMHGGTMSYEPNVPHGAIFRVRFPAIGA